MKTIEEQREGREGRKTHSMAVKLLAGQSQRTDNLRKKFCGIFHPTHKSLLCVFWTQASSGPVSLCVGLIRN